MIIKRELPESAKQTEDKIFEEIIRDGLEQIVDKLLEECSTYEEAHDRLWHARLSSQFDVRKSLINLVKERAIKQPIQK
ncbi:hypothetical protein [Streptococcus suis]|uniref:hypothetical protein n=1 Tax=Streptococcus suis TaxID=1307 RepID=UPI0003FB053C|nr:hypothetical protein [Streptococcus suis]